MNADTLLRFEGLSKHYRDIIALDNVSLELKRGEIFGYIGTNGAGKTTSIKVMVGLLRDFKGSYTFENMKMPDNIPNVHKKLGYLPQDVAFQDWRTVEQALTTFGLLSGMPKEIINKEINSTLDLLEIKDTKYRKIQKLSGGTIQKVGIAQAILHKPEFIVLDEPLNGLDPVSRNKVKSIMKELAAQGTTIFFSSHILSDVQDTADRIGILNEGRLLVTGTLDELKDKLQSKMKIEICLTKDVNASELLGRFNEIEDLEVKENGYIVTLKSKNDSVEFNHNSAKLLIENNNMIYSIAPIIPSLDEIYEDYIKGDLR